ncbi:MAG: hypothetical protein K5634_06320 [Sphaerochaetaceae bacterium]|nr:hypothetical protein [Sphaerochaetaceae bacterium]
MKKNIFIILAVFAILFVFASCSPATPRSIQIYNPSDLAATVYSSSFIGTNSVSVPANSSASVNVWSSVSTIKITATGFFYDGGQVTYNISSGNITLIPTCCGIKFENNSTTDTIQEARYGSSESEVIDLDENGNYSGNPYIDPGCAKYAIIYNSSAGDLYTINYKLLSVWHSLGVFEGLEAGELLVVSYPSEN